MAEQMQDIKRRIKSIQSTERITNAMKLVSAAKLRRAKAIFEHSRYFLDRLLFSINETFDNNTGEVPKDFLLGSRDIKTTCYVMITSSNGLCGSYNTNVIRAMEENIAKAHNNTKLVTIGSKGREHFERRGYEILNEHDAPADSVTFEDTQKISIPLIEMYRKGEIDEIVLVYTAYINPLKQEVITKRLVPLDLEGEHNKVVHKRRIEYEPSAKYMFDYLITKYVELMVYATSMESATCEYASIRTEMENANVSATYMLKTLRT